MAGVLRVIRDGVHDGPWNMARDAELLASHTAGQDPVLRIYQWSPACVSLGYNQREGDFDTEAARTAGFDFVRRPTGGRAILHAHELTYAVIGSSPGPLFGDSLHAAYMTINRGLLAFLVELGLQADVSAGESRHAATSLVCFRSAGRHELSIGGRKIIGSAQRRTRGVFLQHGSILAGPEHRRLVDVLPLDDRRRRSQEEELAAGTTDLQEQLGRSLDHTDLEQLGDRLVEICARTWDLEIRQVAGK